MTAFEEILARGSKSFRLASRLLPRGVRDDAAVAYAWCRRVDDAIDRRPAGERPAALAALRRELDDTYAGRPPADRTAAAFAEIVRRRAVPRAYPEALLDGMAMDVAGRGYATLDELLLYCWRVAGVVGLIMCHVMGLARAAALRHAAHLGIAMQLTNICRDVEEDWCDGRLYLPRALLGPGAGELPPPGGPLPRSAAVTRAVAALLAEAEHYYRSGEAGVGALRWRCALAVRTARLVYAAIGGRIAARRFDVHAGRAVVPLWRKLALLGWALLRQLAAPALRRFRPAPLPTLRFPDDVLPL